ncbi:hypothetical protein [Variovorax sp. KK3]|nr:hypothetical protein [Variovorax sp. KK3]
MADLLVRRNVIVEDHELLDGKSAPNAQDLEGSLCRNADRTQPST